MPFNFEGRKRSFQAVMGVAETKEFFEDITIISNDDLLKNIDQRTTMREAFKVVDEVVLKKIRDFIWE